MTLSGELFFMKKIDAILINISTVPYEKGFHFVWYLDRLVGRENFDKFIPHYFGKWTNKSLDSFEFRDTFLEFFSGPEYASLKDKIAEIDWEGRFFTPGLPPKPEFDTSLADVCYALAEKWKNPDFSPSLDDISSWTGNQVLVFLNTVSDFESPMTPERTVRDKPMDIFPPKFANHTTASTG